MGKWTIELHGDGFALYVGRDDTHHGLNLLQITQVDAVRWDKVKPLIEASHVLAEALLAVLKLFVEPLDFEECRQARAALRDAGVEG